MEIKNETVYVIYRNGKPYGESSRKTVYTKRGSANGVITNVCKDLARYADKSWKFNKDELDKLTEEYKKEFEVVEYKPVKGN